MTCRYAFYVRSLPSINDLHIFSLSNVGVVQFFTLAFLCLHNVTKMMKTGSSAHQVVPSEANPVDDRGAVAPDGNALTDPSEPA